MVEFATEVIQRIGVVGAALLIALESVVPPIPSELVLLLTGFNVSEGEFAMTSALAMTTAGSVLGAWALYAVGALVGEDRMEAFLASVGRIVGLQRRDIDRAFAWFERHGPAVVVFGRMIPLVRSLVSVPAGAERMPFLRFTGYTALGSLVWNAVWITLGWQLGDAWERAERISGILEAVVVAVGATVFVTLVVRSRRARAAERALVAAEADQQ